MTDDQARGAGDARDTAKEPDVGSPADGDQKDSDKREGLNQTGAGDAESGAGYGNNAAGYEDAKD